MHRTAREDIFLLKNTTKYKRVMQLWKIQKKTNNPNPYTFWFLQNTIAIPVPYTCLETHKFWSKKKIVKVRSLDLTQKIQEACALCGKLS